MTENSEGSLPETVRVLLGIGALYVLGFVIANVHFAQYGIARIELIRGRYVGAALLCLLMSIMPIACTSLLYEDLFHPQAARWGVAGRVKRFMIGIAIIAVCYPFWWGIYSLLSARRLEFFDSRALTFWLVALMLGFGARGWVRLGFDPIARGRYTAQGFVTAVVLGIAILIAGAFGFTIYPQLHPAVAGGGAWKGAVELDTGKLTIQGVIVDRSEEFLTLVQCITGKETTVLRLEIPVSRVHGISLTETVSVPDYLRSTDCSPIKAERAAPNDQHDSVQRPAFSPGRSAPD